jgi:UDP-N-acetylglucosamine--N-acetylmuramyl-(pentapeptide) pyrophosphoryl-undecaprenol N-acetylglucosamine transferase
MSVSEICLTQKPAILVPSPNVAEDHQTKNANALVKNNAAVLVTDAQAGEELNAAIDSLMGNAERRAELSENVGKMAHRDAAEKIAQEVLSLIKKN